jgi:hypothetical protein
MFKRKPAADGRDLYAGERFEPRHQLLRKGSGFFRLLGIIALHFCSKTLSRIKPGPALQHMRKAANQQARAAEQQNGKTDL